MLKKMVDNASKNNVVKRVLADGTYDSKKNFQYLHDNGIKAAIKVRKNSNSKAMGCYPRKIAVLQQLKDFDKWIDSVSMDIDGWQKKLCSHQSRECLENMCLLENSQT